MMAPHFFQRLSGSACAALLLVPNGEAASRQSVEPSAEVRRAFNLSPFYKKWVDANGLPVVGSEKVSDAALHEAAYLANQMLTGLEPVRRALIAARVRIAVIASTEQTTDIPEHRDVTPQDYWNQRARGFGATADRPAISCAEENLLRLPSDRYRGDGIFIHEFAHTIHLMGLNVTAPKMDALLQAAYKNAMANGLWRGTYAATNHIEYFAEGVQSYFDCHAQNDPSHGPINTHAELKTYDPILFSLVDRVFRGSRWRYTPPNARRNAD